MRVPQTNSVYAQPMSVIRLPPAAFRLAASVCVVMASGGYPGSYPTGLPISGLEAVDADVQVFHAGTRRLAGGEVVTAGGRVLGVTALGDTLADAKRRAYEAVDCIDFPGMFFRRDIADKALKPEN